MYKWYNFEPFDLFLWDPFACALKGSTHCALPIWDDDRWVRRWGLSCSFFHERESHVLLMRITEKREHKNDVCKCNGDFFLIKYYFVFKCIKIILILY